MDLKILFKDFNASKFVFFVCLLPLSILVSLRLNKTIDWSMWIIFIPLWLLNILVIAAGIVGSVVWFQHPEYRNEREAFADYKAMLITFGIHLLLLMFEGLLCDKIERNGENMWLLVFTPLFFAFPVSVAACVWGIRNDRSLELEMVLSINILLFIFVALQLDAILNWSWAAVFVPLWIGMSLPCIASLYYFIWSLIFYRSNYPRSDRQSHLYMSIVWISVVVSFLTFLILLAYKLDRVRQYSWLEVFAPLHVAIFCLILITFGSRNGNRWWFGLRADFCLFLLEKCPCLRLYGNISFKFPIDGGRLESVPDSHLSDAHIYGASIKSEHISVATAKFDPVVAIESIESPD